MANPPRSAVAALPGVLLVMSLGLAALPLPAAEPVKRITWLVGDALKPGSGQEAARPSDELIGFIKTRLTDIEHPQQLANAKRSWQFLAQGSEMCVANSVLTAERARVAYFTQTALMPPPQLVVRRDRLGDVPLNSAGQVVLARLFAQGKLRGALVEGRSFGPEIDAQLQVQMKRQEAASDVALYTFGDFGSRVLPMLVRGRADYAIEYDLALVWLAGSEPNIDELTTVPIQGAAEPLRVGIACPRTAWGLAAVKRVDAALGSPEGAALLRQMMVQQLTPQTRQRYALQFEAFYAARSRPSAGF